LEVNFIQIKKVSEKKEAERILKNFKKEMEKLGKLYDIEIERAIDKNIYFNLWIWIKRKGWIKYRL